MHNVGYCVHLLWGFNANQVIHLSLSIDSITSIICMLAILMLAMKPFL